MNLSRLRIPLRRAMRGALVSALLLLPALAHAADILVPSQGIITIQDGVNAASSGDTVLIASGTYTGAGNRDIDFSGKSLTVRSQSGSPFDVTIDCAATTQDPHRAFYVNSNEQNVTLRGLTIVNGFAPGNGNGGAVYVDSGQATVTLTRCIFQNDSTNNNYGGGIYVHAAASVLQNCTFDGCVSYDGGGAFLSSQTVAVQDCRFTSNSAAFGGGLFAINNGSGTSLTVSGCRFHSNIASIGNGGMYLYGGNGVMDVHNCVVSGTQISGSGGWGGGVYVYASNETVTMSNCTFAGNVNNGGGTSNGGAALVYLSSSSTARISNCIAREGDNSGFSSEIALNPDSTSTSSVDHSDIQGGYAGTGNIDADPQFVNAANGDFHLLGSSPCLGVGDVNSSPLVDMDNIVRPNPPSMGAYDLPFIFGGVTLVRARLYGGETTTATVSVNRPAPAGGLLVSLASNTGYARVPGSVMIAAGQTSASFAAVSRPVAALKLATLTATLSGDAHTAGLLIDAPALQALTLSASSVTGGAQNATATVTLTSTAPAGGVIVSLNSDTGYAPVPATVYVPAGYRTATFAVVTKRVSAPKGVTLKARLGSVVKVAALLLTP